MLSRVWGKCSSHSWWGAQGRSLSAPSWLCWVVQKMDGIPTHLGETIANSKTHSSFGYKLVLIPWTGRYVSHVLTRRWVPFCPHLHILLPLNFTYWTTSVWVLSPPCTRCIAEWICHVVHSMENSVKPIRMSFHLPCCPQAPVLI